MMKITALAGGVGGAKLANGLAKILSQDDFGIIVNTGDDFDYLGFYICPDIDTVMYNLAGINNQETGYGIQGDTYHVISGLERLGYEVWFHIGDTDIATQIERRRLLNSGFPLSEIVMQISRRLGITHKIFPMCNEPVHTMIVTDEAATLSFQEYFVKFHYKPVVKKIIFEGSVNSRLPLPAKKHLEVSEVVIICPSNPYVSIDPILSVPGVYEAIKGKIVVAVSPLIGGKTIKGPAAKIMTELGIKVNSISIARHYSNLLTGMVIDTKDQQEMEQINHCGIISYATDIYMPDVHAQEQLAGKVVNFCMSLLKGRST